VCLRLYGSARRLPSVVSVDSGAETLRGAGCEGEKKGNAWGRKLLGVYRCCSWLGLNRRDECGLMKSPSYSATPAHPWAHAGMSRGYVG